MKKILFVFKETKRGPIVLTNHWAEPLSLLPFPSHTCPLSEAESWRTWEGITRWVLEGPFTESLDTAP